jgi:hypothetical protein
MGKLIVNSVFVALIFVAGIANAFQDNPINFGIDCMVHNEQGKMLANLGDLGVIAGHYADTATYPFNKLRIYAELKGPYAEMPDMPSPQFKLTVFDNNNNILASLISVANPNISVGLYVPLNKIYIHCDKMN